MDVATTEGICANGFKSCGEDNLAGAFTSVILFHVAVFVEYEHCLVANVFYPFGDSNRILLVRVKERYGCVSLFVGKESAVHEGLVGSITGSYFKFFAAFEKAEN